MINRWFYVDGTAVEYIGRMSIAKAKEYEMRNGRLLLTQDGLDILRKNIEWVLK